MKMNCVRDIMQLIESRYHGCADNCIIFPKELQPKWTEDEVKHHLAIMAGPFLKWTWGTMDKYYLIREITPMGVEFLAMSRDDRIWQIAMHAAKDTLPFEPFMDLLKKLTTERALDYLGTDNPKETVPTFPFKDQMP